MASPQLSLRRHLLLWLLLPLIVLWALDSLVTYQRSLEQVNAGFDRTLMGSALMIAERVTVQNGQLRVDIPYAALEMLENGFHDRIFYKVTDRSAGGLLNGYEDLPPPPQLPLAGAPVYYSTEYRQELVRVVAVLRPIYDPLARGPVLIQVAETTGSRESLARRLLLESTSKELASILLVALLVWLGVRRGLLPLSRLRQRLVGRDDDDLTPIPVEEVPREVAPLIEAINGHMGRQARLNETQRRFVADASHQLKTPLTVLKTQAELALRQEDFAQVRSIVAAMRDATDATARMVEQLLSLARKESAEPLPLTAVDLDPLVRETLLELMPLALVKSVDLGYEGSGPLIVNGSRLLLRELLANLVDNAIRYVPPAGRVTVRVGREGQAPVLDVEDDGPGIPPEQRGRLAERFYRPAGAAGVGSGLGLAIVAEICHRHRAALDFGGATGASGLRVRVIFPVE